MLLSVVATREGVGGEELSGVKHLVPANATLVPTSISLVLLRSGKTFDGSNITEACRGRIICNKMSEDYLDFVERSETVVVLSISSLS